MGCCPRCAAETHVALPPSFALGVGDALKAQGAHLWKDFGPWGGRRSAARKYVQTDGYFPDGWDWAASSLIAGAPNPYCGLLRVPAGRI